MHSHHGIELYLIYAGSLNNYIRTSNHCTINNKHHEFCTLSYAAIMNTLLLLMNNSSPQSTHACIYSTLLLASYQ